MCATRVWHSLFYEACGFFFSFPFFIATFSHSARGRIFEDKVGDTLLLLCSFSSCFCIWFPSIILITGPVLLFLILVIAAISIFFSSTIVWVFFFFPLFFVLFYLLSPFLSISGVLIFFLPFFHTLSLCGAVRERSGWWWEIHLHIHFSFAKSCFVFFFSFWKMNEN